MNVIFALPRSSSRPSWSVTRTFCSLSEGLGGAVDADFGKFKPIKKKKKRVQPREVDVCLCSEDIEENVKSFGLFSLPSLTPPIAQTGNWPPPPPPGCGSSLCRKGSPEFALNRGVANLLKTSPPKSVARSRNASARVIRAQNSGRIIVHCFYCRLQSGGSYSRRSRLCWHEAISTLSWSTAPGGEIRPRQVEDRRKEGGRRDM